RRVRHAGLFRPGEAGPHAHPHLPQRQAPRRPEPLRHHPERVARAPPRPDPAGHPEGRAQRRPLRADRDGRGAVPARQSGAARAGDRMAPRTAARGAPAVKILTRSLVRHAHAIARESGARAVLLYADVVEEDADLAGLIQDVDFRTILVSRRPGFRPPAGWDDLCAVVTVPDIPMTRAGQ